MRILIVSFVLLIILVSGGCRDREETALQQLDRSGYGFAVSDFLRAAASGDGDGVARFLEAGMAVDVEGADGMTAFQHAASNDRDEVVKQLIEAGAKVDQRLADGRTMLMRVAGRTSNDLRMLNYLLRHHADAQAVDGSGMTALMVAAMAGHVDGVRRLASLDVRSLDRALMLSAAQGHAHCLEALIARGAYVNCRSRDSRTPLMYAAGKGHAEASLVLLRHHANRFARDDDGRTAADRAEEAGNLRLAHELRDTSSLVPSGTPAEPEPIPSLDGQSIALHEAPPEKDGMASAVATLEPKRPTVDDGFDRQGGSSARTAALPASPQTTAIATAPIDLAGELQLGTFQERFEHVLVTEVLEDGAQVRLLHRPREEGLITVMVGERIPETPYEVTRVTKRVVPAKGGGTVDVSEVMAVDTQREREQRFVRGTLPRDESSHLLVETKHSQKRFAAHVGDVFTVAETGEQYLVTEIRPHQLLLRRESTMEIITIQRE